MQTGSWPGGALFFPHVPYSGCNDFVLVSQVRSYATSWAASASKDLRGSSAPALASMASTGQRAGVRPHCSERSQGLPPAHQRAPRCLNAPRRALSCPGPRRSELECKRGMAESTTDCDAGTTASRPTRATARLKGTTLEQTCPERAQQPV